jgi:hypothetical protein
MTVKENLLLPLYYWIPFTEKSEAIAFRSDRSGIGDGEEKVIAELGARHEKNGGYSSSFDLALDHGLLAGTKWEVKRINKKTDEVRSGRDGKKAIGPLTDILKRYIIEAYDCVEPLSFDAVKGFERDFIFSELGKMRMSLSIGEFSAGAFYGSKKHPLGLIQIANLFCDNVALLEAAWKDMAKPSRAFEEVDGVILTNEDDGFAMITKNEIDNYLTFNRISLGTAKYVINRE